MHPSARFGELNIKDETVLSLKRKPRYSKDGLMEDFVFEPKFLDFLNNDSTVLEVNLEKLSSLGELVSTLWVFGNVDTIRDKEVLERLWKSGEKPWIKK